MEPFEITPTGAVTLVLVVSALLLLLAYQLRKKRSQEVQDKFGREDVILKNTSANCLGWKSKSRWEQEECCGALVLTHERLYFLVVFPRHEIDIPLDRIDAITQPRSFMGQSILLPLLRVDFTTDAGQDAIAWILSDPNLWQQKLEAAMADFKRSKSK